MKHDSKKEGVWLILIKFQGEDFSKVEDSTNAFEIISEIADLAGHSALAEAKAAGVPRVFVRNNEIIRLLPDGTEEIMKDPHSRQTKFYYHYKPATILHALKK